MSKRETIIVMGNGPSLADIDLTSLDNFDTFGLNSAYRAYERLNWYPTYHGCFDYVVTESHKDNFVKLIESGNIKKCFYISKISDSPKMQYVNLQPYGTTNRWNCKIEDFDSFHDNGNSGANACSTAVCMGYKRIILLGVDCNYVEFIDGSQKDGPGLVIKETPNKNPNYWFDDYQQKGDKYNVPRGTDFHMPTWNMLAYKAANAGIEIINCSPTSALQCFRNMPLKEALENK